MNINQDRYARRYGIHYQATKGMSIKEVAAHMRRVVRQAAKDGLICQDYRYSVKLSRASMSSAINIYIIVPNVVDEERRAYNAEGGKPSYHNADRLWFDTPRQEAFLTELANTERALLEIHHAYNYDGSDAMTDYFDVRFYGFVNVVSETDWERFYK